MCVTVCNMTFANPLNNTCDPQCPASLLTDIDSLQCLGKCLSGYYAQYSNMSCVKSCNWQVKGEYADPVTRICSQNCSREYYSDNFTGECV